MFELSKNTSIQMEIFQDSKIYTIDNFYENPDSVVEYFLKIVPSLYKIEEKPSYNSIYFEDRRHVIYCDDIVKVTKFLEFLCGQPPNNPNNLIMTNAARFKKCEFNNYKNNYWHPHLDPGYTGIVYLNLNDHVSGTNLYEILNYEEEPLKIEHSAPWRSKDNYRLVKTLIPRYNRLVLFDGLKFYHGMNICNDDYFSESFRFNQVFFFKQN